MKIRQVEVPHIPNCSQPRCKHTADNTCPACQRWFCYRHLTGYSGEPHLCRECNRAASGEGEKQP